MSDFRKRSTLRRAALGGVACLVAGLAAGAAAEASPQGRAALGKGVYRIYCASCHGEAARGDGKLAQYLTVEPADLTRLAAGNDGEFPAARLEQVIDGRHGVRAHGGDMPVWGDVFQNIDVIASQPREAREVEVAQKIADLVAYLRSIQATEAAAEAAAAP